MRWKRGTTREVILVGRWAVKVPSTRSWRLFLTGLLCNMRERAFSRMGEPRLCPVRYSCPGGWWVVMPRCEPITDAECDLASMAYADLPFVEKKACSFGRLPDGRIVAVDYG